MIYLGADHRGYKLKEIIKEWLMEWEEEFIDLGGQSYNKDDDYPLISINLAEKVVREKGRGILVCGSGVGVSIAANKVKGARAGLCLNEKQAYESRNDDNVNILCLSADMVNEDENKQIIYTFLQTIFGSEERFVRRINQIKAYESKEC